MSPLFRRGDHSRERTPEERERARAERAARRAAKRGEPVPDLFDVESTAPPPPPEEVEPEREVEAEPVDEPSPEEQEAPPVPPPVAEDGVQDEADHDARAEEDPLHDDPDADAAVEQGRVHDEPDPGPPRAGPSGTAEPQPGPPEHDPPAAGEHDPPAACEPDPPARREPDRPPAPQPEHDPPAANGPQPASRPAADAEPAPPAHEPDPMPDGEPAPFPAAVPPPSAVAPDDPLVGRREPEAQAQATAEIPLAELPDGGESFLEEEDEGDDNHEPPPSRPSLPRRPQPPPPPPPPRPGRRWLVRILAVLALLLAAAAIWFVVSLFQPFKGDASTQRSTVLIPGGADAGKIGDILERRGVVSSSFFFDVRARLSGDRDRLRPGVYRLPQDSSYADVLNRLTQGPPPVKKVAITVPEGRSRREEAVRIRANSNLEGSYLAATKRSRLLRPARYGAPRGTPSLEGFLFPATYELKSDAPVKQLVGEQLRAFKRAIRRVDMRAARRRNVTTYEVLTIASMVEREAMLRRERPIIAGVIYNRLRRNIPLGIDATIRYATGNWGRPLTQSQLRIPSAYNTRTHQGLPPTPIGSPGIAAIRAAAHPKRTPYLYYVVKPGGCGEHAFTTSFAAFQRASARYEAARAKQGGRSPTKCPK
ncbi:MAG: endolytic transglycosylase MltG [Solirubrobacteraceae bacterium]